MRVLVLGSGVVGVASAWYLARAGHEVTVLDRQPAAGMETSFANAGQVSPGYSAPWAGPGIPIKAMKWLMMRHRPLVPATLALVLVERSLQALDGWVLKTGSGHHPPEHYAVLVTVPLLAIALAGSLRDHAS